MGAEGCRPLLQPREVRLLRRQSLLQSRSRTSWSSSGSTAIRSSMTCGVETNITDDPVTQSNKRGLHHVRDARPQLAHHAGLHQLQGQRRFSIRRASRRSVRSCRAWRSSTSSTASTASSRVRCSSRFSRSGNAYLTKSFPRLDYIKKATHREAGGSAAARQAAGQEVTASAQYVARPPLMSNTAPVENEQSSEDSQQIRAATSSSSRKRPIGILASM